MNNKVMACPLSLVDDFGQSHVEEQLLFVTEQTRIEVNKHKQFNLVCNS